MWLLLPPVFITTLLLAWAAPFFVRKSEKPEPRSEEFVSNRAVAADRSR